MKTSTQTKKQAIALKNSYIAEALEAIQNGACRHGNTDRGYDMEQSCHGCEMGDTSTITETGYLIAKNHIRTENARILLERIQTVIEMDKNYPLKTVYTLQFVINDFMEGAN